MVETKLALVVRRVRHVATVQAVRSQRLGLSWFQLAVQKLECAMNRRNFLQSVCKVFGATAAVPLVPLAIQKRGWFTDRMSPKIQAAREELVWSLLPPEVTISDEMFRWLEYLKEQQLAQLGIRDLAALKKTKLSS